MTVVSSGASNTPPSVGAAASLSQKRKPAAAIAAARLRAKGLLSAKQYDDGNTDKRSRPQGGF